MENNLASPSLPPLATLSHRKFPLAATVVAAVCIVVVLFVGAVIGYGVVSVFSGGTLDPRHMTIVQGLLIQLFMYIALVPYLLLVMTKLWRVSLGDLGFRMPTWRNIAFALLGAVGMMALVQGSAAFIQLVTHTHHQEQAVQILKAIKVPSVLALFTLFAVIIAPFVEELTFRVFLFTAAARVTTVWVAALLSGILFGAAHWDKVAFIPLAIGGMLLCYLYFTTRNAWISMISHGLFNGTTILALVAAPHFVK